MPSEKNINELNNELGIPLDKITQAMGRSKGTQLNSKFKTCGDHALGKAKKAGVSKVAVACSTVKGKRLFIDASTPSTASKCSKKH